MSRAADLRDALEAMIERERLLRSQISELEEVAAKLAQGRRQGEEQAALMRTAQQARQANEWRARRLAEVEGSDEDYGSKEEEDDPLARRSGYGDDDYSEEEDDDDQPSEQIALDEETISALLSPSRSGAGEGKDVASGSDGTDYADGGVAAGPWEIAFKQLLAAAPAIETPAPQVAGPWETAFNIAASAVGAAPSEHPSRGRSDSNRAVEELLALSEAARPPRYARVGHARRG